MARYIALRDTLIAHECRVVKEGQEFETTFPAGMKIGDNLQVIEDDKPAAKNQKATASDDLV